MQYRIEISSEQKEDIIIFAKEKTSVLEKIEEIISAEKTELLGYSENDIIKISKDEVYCFLTENGRIYAMTEGGRWQLKERLYTLEEKFSLNFVKINQSCLVKIDKIAKFRTTIGGALQVVLKNGYTDYVSRRQLKEVKERIGI